MKRMCEERKQMLQKIIDNDEQWEKAKEEVTQVIAQHTVIQTKLEEQEQLTFMEEQRARVSDNMLCTFSMCSPDCMHLDSYTNFSFELSTFSLDKNGLRSMTLVDDRKFAEQVKNASQDVGIHISLLMTERQGCSSLKYTVQKETGRALEDVIRTEVDLYQNCGKGKKKKN